MTNDGGVPRIVIIGGGFGGLYAARVLRRARARVTMIDRRNHHLFQPLLYQVATAALNSSDIAAPIRSVLHRQKNVTVLLAEARGVDLGAKKVLLTDGELPYDYLIVAAGATHSYFGHDQWAELAPGLKSLEDALEIRRRVLYAFEAAEREPDPARRRAWMTFVVIGAGPTGVELAGALSEISRHTLTRDFRHINPAEARIVLVEGGPRVLAAFSPQSQESAARQLAKIGVEVRTDAKVTGIDEQGVVLDETERIDARTKIWGAGVIASPLGASLGAPVDRSGRVRVTSRLTVPGHDEIFVVGDLAAVEHDGKPVPGVAPAAMQGGAYAARAILAALDGKSIAPFRYWDKGSLATIGRSAAVADLGRLRLSGFVAWAAWLLIHILYLIGFRNRLLVLVEWGWAYVTYQRGARLITGAERARIAHDRPQPREGTPPPSRVEAARDLSTEL